MQGYWSVARLMVPEVLHEVQRLQPHRVTFAGREGGRGGRTGHRHSGWLAGCLSKRPVVMEPVGRVLLLQGIAWVA